MAVALATEEEERVKAMSPKEREEYKKSKLKPTGNVFCSLASLSAIIWHNSMDYTGRQLFERDRNFGADDEEGEEGVVSVDITQYERRTALEEEEEVDRIHFSDSD